MLKPLKPKYKKILSKTATFFVSAFSVLLSILVILIVDMVISQTTVDDPPSDIAATMCLITLSTWPVLLFLPTTISCFKILYDNILYKFNMKKYTKYCEKCSLEQFIESARKK
ncbi:hypothetical protein AVV36_gp146 [Pectobacterium bacteriophage PM2]|uniref:Uncharacterized protein n=1 Tax=Pectobacterium bacteriophage PM2 TaxID=1429794 RepID=A0A0A0Q0Q0_9CAUD|nr:hypothetical protein AVV36_gp146 [Pectobacterium bacteriophage PM2]AHY25108.1 hypothetical protein PM2_146 [Pectobacterium bacteriophage PM2]